MESTRVREEQVVRTIPVLTRIMPEAVHIAALVDTFQLLWVPHARGMVLASQTRACPFRESSSFSRTLPFLLTTPYHRHFAALVRFARPHTARRGSSLQEVTSTINQPPMSVNG